MNRITLMVALALTFCATAQPALGDDTTFNFLKEGYGFTDGTSFGGVGLLEVIQFANPPLDFDFVNYEVTWLVRDMVIESVSGTMVKFYELSGGVVSVMVDPAFDFNYGSEPATGLATAGNGEVVLSGEILGGAVIHNLMSNVGTLTCSFVFTGGSRYEELAPLAQNDWFAFEAICDAEEVEVPDGYHSRWAGRFYSETMVATVRTNWSDLKNLYR